MVTSGGVSVGAYDVVKEVLSGLGTVTFESVAMQPGKPQGFGLLDDRTPIFTLPGNPVSAYVSFEVFVRPGAARAAGTAAGAAADRHGARSPQPITSPPGMRQFLRGAVSDDGVDTVPPGRAGRART